MHLTCSGRFDAAQFSFEDIGGSTCADYLMHEQSRVTSMRPQVVQGGFRPLKRAAAAESAEGTVVAMRYGAGTEFERPVKCFIEANDE
jgi:hypothetical protein